MGLEFKHESHAMHAQAKFYLRGATRIYGNMENTSEFTKRYGGPQPVILLLAISSELFLKFLIAESGKTYSRTHEIKKLFSSLDKKTQNDIKLDFGHMLELFSSHDENLTKITYKNRTLETSNSDFITDYSIIFEKMLNQINSSFPDWRYLFEKNNLEIDILYFSIFVECLNRETDYVCEHKYPDFK
ncbi:hypothetical protein HNP87_000173 [Methanococcus maripaludis]|uniref:HEPN domain-containing protein n=1 Tax=Methanococcus maripaludis TaxID=39152 RepID=A0A7J9NGJ8_METMI|nr:hypothetical protein [Methanococcus maripaludis]MBA2839661.1 hypothetical protein [Methanococcus maripaludis]